MISQFFRWLVSLFRKKPPVPSKGFFGRQVQGELLATPEKITVPFGTLRIWNNGASYEWVFRNNWEGLDIALKFAEVKGVEVIYVLLGEVGAQLPADEAWRSFVDEAVTRAGGRIKYWEPLNEPVYLEPRDPARCLELSRMAYEIIRARVPGAVILSPSLNELSESYARDFATAYIDLMAAKGTSADAIAFHSYRDHEADRQTLLSLMNRHGMDLPIYLTETVASPEEIQSMVGKVECVVENDQVAP